MKIMSLRINKQCSVQAMATTQSGGKKKDTRIKFKKQRTEKRKDKKV